MWFLFGLIVGSSLAGSPGAVLQQQLLSQIPIGCFAALEESEEAYRYCRTPSMMARLDAQSRFYPTSTSLCWDNRFGKSFNSNDPHSCDVKQHITWELAALKRMNEEAKKVAR
jgi:hypothetical protein